MARFYTPGMTTAMHGAIRDRPHLTPEYPVRDEDVASDAAIAQSKLALSADPGAHASRHAYGGPDQILQQLNPAAFGYGLKKLVELTLTSDATWIDIGGLDLDTHRFYLIWLRAKNPTASTAVYRIFFNGDTTTTNYYNQRFWANGSSVGGGRVNDAYLEDSMAAGTDAVILALVSRDPSLHIRWLSFNNHQAPSAIEAKLFVGHWNKTENVTSIEINSSVTNGIGAYSSIIIYGVSG